MDSEQRADGATEGPGDVAAGQSLLGEIDVAEIEDKHSKYEALYAHRLRAKYFSKKALDGGDIFENEITIQNETIKSSRWPCTRSFADPIQYQEDRNKASTEADTTAMSNNKQPSKKSG